MKIRQLGRRFVLNAPNLVQEIHISENHIFYVCIFYIYINIDLYVYLFENLGFFVLTTDYQNKIEVSEENKNVIFPPPQPVSFMRVHFFFTYSIFEKIPHPI